MKDLSNRIKKENSLPLTLTYDKEEESQLNLHSDYFPIGRALDRDGTCVMVWKWSDAFSGLHKQENNL